MKNRPVRLPYDSACPVIYDNDSHCDVYTDELLLVLASAGTLDVRGFITTTTRNPAVNFETFEMDFAGREEILAMARRSGMRNIPPHARGPSVMLQRPASGAIEDTQPIGTPGTRLIIDEARKATPEKPLVLLMGGPLTAAADAWLLDHGITDRVVVAWLGGTQNDMFDYNGWADPWAAYIALMKLKLVQFPVGMGMPEVPKDRLAALPDCELRQWMTDKRLPHVNRLPHNIRHDGDSQPVIPMLNAGYARAVKRVSFDRWGNWCGVELPVYRDDENGTAVVVTDADKDIATAEWWKAVENSAAWGERAPAKAAAQRSHYAAPFPIGPITRVEAEDFDHGGEGLAYHKLESDRQSNPYRDTGVRIIPAEDAPGGYNQGANGGFCVAGMRGGEWLEYEVNVKKAGRYDIGVRAASAAGGGAVRLAFGGADATGAIAVPATGGETAWQDVWAWDVLLKAGKQHMRLAFEPGCEAINVNYISIVPVSHDAIRPHPENPRYFLFRGKPTVLVTATEHYGAGMNAAFRHEEYLDMLRSYGFNLTRVFVLMREHVREFKGFMGRCNTLAPDNAYYLAPWKRSRTPGCLDGGNKFDLTQWNEAFFARLKDFCGKASERDIAVEVVFFSQLYNNKEDGPWPLSALNPANNIQGIGAAGYNRYTSVENQKLLAVQEALVRKVVRELNRFDNVYYEVCNEPPYPEANDPEDMPADHPHALGEKAVSEWHNHLAQAVIDEETALGRRHMAAVGDPHESIDITLFSIYNYHYRQWIEYGLKNHGDHNKAMAFDETLTGIVSWNREMSYEARRREAWEFFTRGVSVYDYLDLTVTAEDPLGTGNAEFPGGRRFDGTMMRLYLKHLKTFMDGLDLIHMRPDNSIIKNNIAPAEAWVLAAPGREYAAYLYGSAVKYLTVALPQGNWRAEWFNPLTGRIDKAEDGIAGGAVTLVLPLYHSDIALRLSRRD